MKIVDADIHLAAVALVRLSTTRPPSFAWTHDMLIVCVPYWLAGLCTDGLVRVKALYATPSYFITAKGLHALKEGMSPR